MPDHQHGAVSVRANVLADQAQEHPDETAVSPGSDHEEVSVRRRIERTSAGGLGDGTCDLDAAKVDVGQ